MPTHLFHELLYAWDHRGWNEDDLAKLPTAEIQDLARVLSAPISGPKNKVIIRLLKTRHVRTVLSKYTCTDEGVAQLVEAMSRKELQLLAKMMCVWRSGNKKQLAITLLQWRDRARMEGQKFTDAMLAAARRAPRQLAFEFPEEKAA